jgi:hypothetical protein
MLASSQDDGPAITQQQKASREPIRSPNVSRQRSVPRRPSIDPAYSQHEKAVEIAREAVNRYRKGSTQHSEALQALEEAEAMLSAMRERRKSGSSADSNTRSRCNTFRSMCACT